MTGATAEPGPVVGAAPGALKSPVRSVASAWEVDAMRDTIGEFIAWGGACGLRPTTLEKNRSVLRGIAAQVGPLEAASPAAYATWWASCVRLAPNTRRGYLARLRTFMAWAADEGLVAADPTVRLRAPVVPRPAPRPIGEAELAQALYAASGRVRSWMLLGAYAGLRACECARLRPEELTVEEVRVRDGKGGHAAVLPAHPRLAEVVVDWPDTLAPVIVSHTVNRYLHGLGIAATMHKLRARFATRVYATSGNDLRLTCELMRHASPTTTAIYVGWSPAAARAAVVDL